MSVRRRLEYIDYELEYVNRIKNAAVNYKLQEFLKGPPRSAQHGSMSGRSMRSTHALHE